MPIIKSAKKRMRQNEVSRVRNHAQTSQMRSLYKNMVTWLENGDGKKAAEMFNDFQKTVDTCVKKNLIHQNNGARKKSRIAKLMANADLTSVAEVPKKKEPIKKSAKKPTVKKAEPKKEEASTEKKEA